MNTDKTGVVIKGMDIIDLTDLISQKGKKFMAIGLQEFEDVFDPSSKEFASLRKIYLSQMNNYTRSIIRALFGEIELD